MANVRANLRAGLGVLLALTTLFTGCAPPAATGGAGGLLGAAPAAGPAGPTSSAPLGGPVTSGLPGPASATSVADGSTVAASEIAGIDPSSRIGDVQFRVVGNPNQIQHVVVICHGDAPAFYASLLDDEGVGAKLQAAGVGALFAFPRSTEREWPGFENGQNGATIVALFDYLIQKSSPNVSCHFGGLSGAGHVLNAFLTTVNAGGAEAVAQRLKTVTDHDALCRSIEPLKVNYATAIRARTAVRFNFIHGEKQGELNTNTTEQHQEVGRRIEPGFTLPRSSPGGVAIQGGRVRFWSGPDHFGCLKGQIFRAYFTP